MIELLYFCAICLIATIGAWIADAPRHRTPALASSRFAAVSAAAERRGVPAVDLRDQKMFTARMQTLDAKSGPRVGDYIQFADGVSRRVSHIWDDGVQTSQGGSYYLGNGWVSFSGSLFPSVPLPSLHLAPWKAGGSVWFFHHDLPTVGGGVHFIASFRVFLCDRVAPR